MSLKKVCLGLTVWSAKTVGVKILESEMEKKSELQRQKNISQEIEVRRRLLQVELCINYMSVDKYLLRNRIDGVKAIHGD